MHTWLDFLRAHRRKTYDPFDMINTAIVDARTILLLYSTAGSTAVEETIAHGKSEVYRVAI